MRSLEDLGIDSLGLVESIFAIEEAFDISVPFNANEPEASDFDISSVAAIVKRGGGPDRGRTAMRRVVITGRARSTRFGRNVPQTFEAMRAKGVAASARWISGMWSGWPSVSAGRSDYEPEALFNRQQIALYDRFTQFTLIAAREAHWAGSGLSFSGDLAARSGVVLGHLWRWREHAGRKLPRGL